MLIERLDFVANRLSGEFPTSQQDCDWAIRTGLEQLLRALTTARVNPTDRRHLAAMAYGSRAMQLSHAAFGCIRSGNIASAQVLTRASLEALFALSALADPKNFEDGKDLYLSLLYKSTFARLVALKRYVKSASLSKELSAQAQAKIATDQAVLDRYRPYKMTTVREVADAASMLDLYERDYAYHSNPSHSDLEHVLRHHVAEKSGGFELKGFAVDHEQSREFSAHLLYVVVEATIAIEHLFQIELADDDRRLRDELAYFYGSALVAVTKTSSSGQDANSVPEPLAGSTGAHSLS